MFELGVDEDHLLEGASALHYAAAGGHQELAENCVGRGADVALPDRAHGASAATWARRAGHEQVAAYLEAVAPMARAIKAVRAGDLDGLAGMLREDPQLVATNGVGWQGGELVGASLLHFATCCDTMRPPASADLITRMLIDAGADVNVRMTGGPHRETPLHYAASVGRGDLCEILLDAGAEVDPEGGVIVNGTPLFEAVIFGMRESAEVLISRGAAMNLPMAASLGQLDRVRGYFYDGELDPEAGSLPCWHETREPQSVLDNVFTAACAAGHAGIATFLLRHGANVNAIDPVGKTSLDYALGENRTTILAIIEPLGSKRAADLG